LRRGGFGPVDGFWLRLTWTPSLRHARTIDTPGISLQIGKTITSIHLVAANAKCDNKVSSNLEG
jgi:hypothetical protein